MKIAYVSLHWPRLNVDGVSKKILYQIHLWESAGNAVTSYMHLHTIKNPQDLLPAKYFFYSRFKFPLLIPAREISRSVALYKLIRTLLEDKPDLIYLRWGMYAFPLQLLSQNIPVIIEINTNDLHQHQLLGHILSTYNKYTRSTTLSMAKGLVFTTNELAKDPDFLSFSSKRIVISNGIDLEGYPFFPAPETKIPHLAFIDTPGLPWQGVEKLIDLAEALPDIHIDIIGYDTIPGIDNIPANVTLHGYLKTEQYQPILSQSTAAIGTISLYKKDMQEAAPLKIRECAAYGLPLILPYQDTDLHGLNCEAILEIPNTENNIMENTERIRDFLYQMRGKRLERKLISSSIDINIKESARLEFFEDCVAMIN